MLPSCNLTLEELSMPVLLDWMLCSLMLTVLMFMALCFGLANFYLTKWREKQQHVLDELRNQQNLTAKQVDEIELQRLLPVGRDPKANTVPLVDSDQPRP